MRHHRLSRAWQAHERRTHSPCAKLTIPGSSSRHCAGSVQHGLSAPGGVLGFFQPGRAADKRYSLDSAVTNRGPRQQHEYLLRCRKRTGVPRRAHTFRPRRGADFSAHASRRLCPNERRQTHRRGARANSVGELARPHGVRLVSSFNSALVVFGRRAAQHARLCVGGNFRLNACGSGAGFGRHKGEASRLGRASWRCGSGLARACSIACTSRRCLTQTLSLA